MQRFSIVPYIGHNRFFLEVWGHPDLPEWSQAGHRALPAEGDSAHASPLAQTRISWPPINVLDRVNWETWDSSSMATGFAEQNFRVTEKDLADKLRG
jgi:hypothetical protein